MVKPHYKKKVAVIGIGRVGLPLSLVLAREGHFVYGVGRDDKKMQSLREGQMPFIEEGGASLLTKLINKNFLVTTDYSVSKECEFIILTLGTPIDENMNPIYDQLNNSMEMLKPYLRPGQTLILRSTVSPRTTQYIKSLVETNKKIRVGKNFYIAFCPERIAEGQSIEEIKEIPQIIGGVDKKSTKIAQEFFRTICEETIATDDVSAELAKLFTNMYRYINFAIANEFMVLASNYNRDVYEIVNLVNFKYKRGGLSVPGLTGGPCLFKDGFFLISDMPFVDLIATSWKINESIPPLLIKRVKERMKLKDKKTVILGLAFKADTDDIRESLSFKVRKELLRERAQVTLHDPYVKEYSNQKIEKNVYKALENADVIFLTTKHKEYRKLNIKKIKAIVKKNCIVCDIWNILGTGKIVYRLNNVNDDRSALLE